MKFGEEESAERNVDWRTLSDFILCRDSKAFNKTIDELNKLKKNRLKWKFIHDKDNQFLQALLNVKRRKISIKKLTTTKKSPSIKSRVAKDVYKINYKNFELPDKDKRVLKERSRKTFINSLLNLKIWDQTKVNRSLNSQIKAIESNDNIKIEESIAKTVSDRVSIMSYKINIKQEV